MRTVLSFILITIFLLSGVSRVPACYATKPDCTQKNTNSCPFSGKTLETPPEAMPSCHLMAQKECAEASFPLEKYKRLKLEQIQHSPTEIPAFIPAFVVSILLETNNNNPAANIVAGEIINLHHHPPPLFIQYQSFLI